MAITYNDYRLRELKRELTRKLSAVQVGIFSHAPRRDTRSNLSNFELGLIHEFGNRHIPARSFLRSAFYDNQAAYKDLVARLAHSVFQERMSLYDAMDHLGKWGVDKVQEKIRSNIPPPLSPDTIRKKGHALALVESGQLYDSIEYKLVVS